MLSSYGRREWLGATLIALPIAIGAVILHWWPLLVLVAVIWFCFAAFFRDPIRRIPTDIEDGAMLSPADGTISAIEDVFEHPATDGGAIIIRIFLSVLNVHVNRMPFDVVVEDTIYTPGEFLDARSAKSAIVNEHNLICLRTVVKPTFRFGVRQVSGAIARRIVCPINTGDMFSRGQRFGMIKFGSTTELILPKSSNPDIRVKPGDKVTGGKTVLAVTSA
jgi:phosphatidylserine decarboxylase